MELSCGSGSLSMSFFRFLLCITKAATVYNEHIAKIAALPRGINICVFLRSLLALIKCWEAATSAICPHVGCKFVWTVHPTIKKY